MAAEGLCARGTFASGEEPPTHLALARSIGALPLWRPACLPAGRRDCHPEIVRVHPEGIHPEGKSFPHTPFVSWLRYESGGGGTRTPDTRIMIPLLWPPELRRHVFQSITAREVPRV